MGGSGSQSRLHYAVKAAVGAVIAIPAALVALAILPGIIGLHPVVVLSGSMVPALRVGDVAVTTAVKDPSTLETGDVVTFRTSSGLVTHRIIDIQDTKEGRLLQTKGDANDTADPTLVPDAHVVAKVAYSIPLVGFLMVLGDSTAGALIFIGGPIGILALMWAATGTGKGLGGLSRRPHSQQAATGPPASACPASSQPRASPTSRALTFPRTGAPRGTAHDAPRSAGPAAGRRCGSRPDRRPHARIPG